MPKPLTAILLENSAVAGFLQNGQRLQKTVAATSDQRPAGTNCKLQRSALPPTGIIPSAALEPVVRKKGDQDDQHTVWQYHICPPPIIPLVRPVAAACINRALYRGKELSAGADLWRFALFSTVHCACRGVCLGHSPVASGLRLLA